MSGYFPYEGKFTFVDVEIPNLNNNCICAISLIVVEDHKEVLRHTELINPRTFFSANNVKIHKIKARDVRDARTMKDFWKDYSRYFTRDYILVAHNAMSDISVINKDLLRNHKKIESVLYVDTMDIMADEYFKGTQSKGDLRLSNIAERLSIPIVHHDPESDVNCCYEILKYMDRNFSMDLKPYIKEIPAMKIRVPKTQSKPSPAVGKKMIARARRRISQRDPAAAISRRQAERRGEHAFACLDYEAVIFNYEVAASRQSPLPEVYQRLSAIYDSLEAWSDSLRVLELGLKAMEPDSKEFKSMQKILNKKRGFIMAARRRKAEAAALPQGAKQH